MFGRWFAPALRAADAVRLDGAACLRALAHVAGQARADSVAVLLLTRSRDQTDELAAALAGADLKLADGPYTSTDLAAHLVRPGAVGLTDVDALRPLPAATRPPLPLHVHVRGRGDRRAQDAALLALLTPWAPASITFHHALDDALLRAHAATLGPLLARLGVGADDALDSPLIGKALQRVQRP